MNVAHITPRDFIAAMHRIAPCTRTPPCVIEELVTELRDFMLSVLDDDDARLFLDDREDFWDLVHLRATETDFAVCVALHDVVLLANHRYPEDHRTPTALHDVLMAALR